MSAEKNINGPTPSWVWKLALAGAAAIWGGSFVVMKDTLDAISPSWLMATRFLLASVLVGALFWRTLRDNLDVSHLAMGAILGLVWGAAYLVQNIGLDDTTPGRNAFLTATYCVIVPFIWWIVARRRPTLINVTTALLALVGIWLVSVSSSDSGLTLPCGSTGRWTSEN